MRNQQTGASFFSTLLVLLMAGSLLAIAFKLYQPYVDHMTITSILEGIVKDPEELKQPVTKIRQDIDKRLRINQVSLPDREVLTLVEKGGVLQIDLDYEVRQPMFFNVDAMVKFSEHYEAIIP